jgi:hypothetical protein
VPRPLFVEPGTSTCFQPVSVQDDEVAGVEERLRGGRGRTIEVEDGCGGFVHGNGSDEEEE